MCENADRYVAIRACATNEELADLLADALEDRDDLNVVTPSQAQFDAFGDVAIAVVAKYNTEPQLS